MLLEHMAWAGVERAVLLQGPFYGEANNFVADAVRQWPTRFVGAAHLDPCAPSARRKFLHLKDRLGFRIFKFEMSVGTGLVGLYPNLRLDGPEMTWIWEVAEEEGLVITLDLGSAGSASYQTAGVATMVERHPHLRVVIAHLGQPPVSQRADRQLDREWEQQLRLAEYPNVWLDLAGLPAYAAGEDYPFPSLAPYLRRAVELVGAHKLMWGTDLPALMRFGTYPQLLQCIMTHFAYLTADQQAQIFGGTAMQVYWG
ncbi:MAG: amidohydrolase [Chloroflexi bacterium]|nr:amidohydrolase [Chloroflexota bacterium]